MEIIAQGNSLKVSVDGTPVFSVTDQSYKTGAVALWSSANQGSVFDDVLVEELPTKAVLLWDDFNNGNFTGWTIFDQPGVDNKPSAWSVVNGELVQNSNIHESKQMVVGPSGGGHFLGGILTHPGTPPPPETSEKYDSDEKGKPSN